MTSSILHAGAGASSRYWLLIHASETHCLEWDDGEQLIALSAAIRTGRVQPQPFTFTARGKESSDPITVFVTPDDPIEMLTEYDSTPAPDASHWFG